MVKDMRSQVSMEGFRSKIKRIVSRHQAMKSTFHQLKVQIEISLLQAEDVFISLSVPLMRLVGLKTAEMAEEGRFATIVTEADWSDQGCESDGAVLGDQARSPYAVDAGHRNYQIRKFELEFRQGVQNLKRLEWLLEEKEEDKNYAAKATMASKELKEKQRLQITQLVHLLRQIETQVNSHHGDIRQTLADHRSTLRKFFQKAISHIAAVHRSGQSQDTFLLILKLFQIVLGQVNAALTAVEAGVEDLMQQLAEQMCNPMVEYVKSLKAEMTAGTCTRLLAMMEEMEEETRDCMMELEMEKMKVRVAEKMKLEALSKLKELEERERRMNEHLGLLLEAKKSPAPRKVRRLC